MDIKHKKQFPDMEWFLRHVVKPGDNRQYAEKRFHDYYRIKYETALKYSPRRICEIGVRLGYSAFGLLLAAPEAHYTGYDILDGTHGGVKGDNFPYVRRMLEGHFPDAKIELIHGDTQRFAYLTGPFDLIHIDGDHTEKGCYHDMKIALFSLSPGGVMIIDDYSYIKSVRAAVVEFVKSYSGRIKKGYEVKTIRGDFVIETYDNI